MTRKIRRREPVKDGVRFPRRFANHGMLAVITTNLLLPKQINYQQILRCKCEQSRLEGFAARGCDPSGQWL